MSIEEVIRSYLDERLDVPVWLEVPKGETIPESYVLLQKTGSSKYNHLCHATVAIQSHGGRLLQAMDLNEAVKTAMDGIVERNIITKAALNSDYNYTDTRTAAYRYQAVYDLTHYETGGRT